MAKEKPSFQEFLDSLKVNYNNYNPQNGNIGFDFGKDEYIQKNVRSGANRNTRKAYAIDDLVDLVGSERHKDIRLKQGFTSPKAFDLWQNKDPSRLKWSCEKVDLDGDGQAEFVVKDKKKNRVAVNGYYLTNSKYPERYAYQETVERDNGRPINNFDDWYDDQIKVEDAYKLSTLNTSYPETLNTTPLYKLWNKYGKVEKKFPKKLRAYKHFSQVLFPKFIDELKYSMAQTITSDENIADVVTNLIKYPGNSAITQARFYTAQCFFAWNQYIIQPILALPKMKTIIESELKDVQDLLKTDKDFQEVHDGDDPLELAISRIKSRSWFKDTIDTIYEKIISSMTDFNNLLFAIATKFLNDYCERTNNRILINEDKLYSYNRRIQRDGKQPLPLKTFYPLKPTDIHIGNVVSSFSGSSSQEPSPQKTPQKVHKSIKQEENEGSENEGSEFDEQLPAPVTPSARTSRRALKHSNNNINNINNNQNN